MNTKKDKVFVKFIIDQAKFYVKIIKMEKSLIIIPIKEISVAKSRLGKVFPKI